MPQQSRMLCLLFAGLIVATSAEVDIEAQLASAVEQKDYKRVKILASTLKKMEKGKPIHPDICEDTHRKGSCSEGMKKDKCDNDLEFVRKCRLTCGECVPSPTDEPDGGSALR